MQQYNRVDRMWISQESGQSKTQAGMENMGNMLSTHNVMLTSRSSASLAIWEAGGKHAICWFTDAVEQLKFEHCRGESLQKYIYKLFTEMHCLQKCIFYRLRVIKTTVKEYHIKAYTLGQHSLFVHRNYSLTLKEHFSLTAFYIYIMYILISFLL